MAKVEDLTKNLTLDEIKVRDIDNLELVLKTAKPVKFESDAQCKFWMGETLRKILAKLGVNLVLNVTGNPKVDKMRQKFAAKQVERQMKEKGVKVENRNYPGNDFTRSGIYVYYENEIAFFISHPMHAKKRAGNLILPGQTAEKELFCMTNWKE
jgi:hypothetical protein